ncbi:MAG: leucine-rich repeat protein [Acutalibacteraceae bacterium]
MFNTKRIISIFLVVLMLFTSLPMNVFAEKATAEETTIVVEEKNLEEENTEYQVGKEYTIKGVRYRVDTDNTVDVLGEGEGISERVEVLSHLDDFTVKEIAYGAFQNCETVKEIILPETVTRISYLAFSGSALNDIEIKGKNVDVRTDFRNTPLNENPDNWKNGVLIVSNYAVMSIAEGNVVLDENIIGIAEHCFGYDSLVTSLTILNPDCHIFNSSGTLPLYATIYGYKDSTAQKHARTYSYNFSVLCGCEGTVFKPATNSYCNGVVGYSEGYWCDNCGTYSSGGFLKDNTFDHTDLDNDGVCDFCKLNTDTEILDAGKCGDKAFWCLTRQGMLIVGGEGEVQGLDESTDIHLQKKRIKEVVFLDGITSIAAKAFDYVDTVEKITISDTVKEIKANAFYQCLNLKEVVFGKGIEIIGSQAFSSSTNLKKVTLNEGLTIIGSSAFSDCRGLEEIYLPDTLETIGYSAFRSCAKLKNVVLPNGLKKIESCAFIYCTSLTEIVIPERVELLDQQAFASCSNLSEVVMKPKYLVVYANAFMNTSVKFETVNGFSMLGTVAFYETEPIHKELVLGKEITSLAVGWPISNTKISEIYVPDKRCYIGSFGLEVKNLVVHGYKDSYAESFAEKVKAFFVPICECENTEFFPATQSSCDGTVGYTEGEWCDYCATWKSGHEINTANIHDFGEDCENCLRCGESKKDKIASVGILSGGFWILTNNHELVVYGKGTVSLPKRTPDIKRWMKVIGEEAKNVRIKNTVEKIGDGLFKNGTSLEKIEVENGIYSIGANAFYNCNNVKEMTLSVILLEIGANAFDSMSSLESVTLSDTVYKIGSAAFKNCTSLKEVTFGGELYNIPNQLFCHCTALENLNFKNTYINNVGEYAFKKCKSLKSIPLSVKGNIETYAFSDCEALKEVTIISPKISAYAFQNCTGLETVNIDADTSMYDGVFQNCVSLKNVNFAQGKKINMRIQSFKGCRSLETIKLPKTWIAIPQEFFYGCTSLKNIELPENAKTIGSSAFYGCSSLKKITLGEKVTAVNSMAFYGADSLSEITFLNKDAKIADPQKVGGVYCHAIPLSALIKGYAASTADIYADNYKNKFLPLDEEKAVKEISVETYPLKHIYVLNKDTEINLYNLTIKVTYEDDTARIFKSRFTVDTSACDLTKTGTYPVKIIFESKETFFMITVSDNDNPLEQNSVVLPENGELKFKFNTTTSVNLKFIPEETKTYYFLTTGNVYERLLMPDGSCKSFRNSYKNDFHKLQVDLVKGEIYYITLDCSKDSSVTIKQTGICDLEELPDGTYKTIRFIGEKSDVVIPSEINGKKVTVIGEKSFEGVYAQSITLGEGIEVIEKESFIKITHVKSVSLPDTLKKIGEKAFCRLSSLETVNGGKNVEEIGDFAFEYCSKLVNFTLSERVRTIGSNAFYGCSFSDITFPETLEKVGDQAFFQCNKLKEINFLCEKADFGSGVFSACYLLEEIALPSGNTQISPAMFSACTALTEIVLPENIVSIGQSAFYNCNKVKNIKFSGNVRSIGSSAFALCNSLETIEIPKTVTDFGNNIFYECNSLKTVTFLGENPDIPEKMFNSCDNLERINYKGTITYVGDSAFRGCSGYSQNEILANLTSIGNYAFAYSNLAEINLSEDITYLGDGAFAHTNAKTAVLPKAVTIIPASLFDCSSIESVTLLGEVTQIGAKAFRYCDELKEINIPPSVEIIEEEAFGYAHALKIIVNLESIREVGKMRFATVQLRA